MRVELCNWVLSSTSSIDVAKLDGVLRRRDAVFIWRKNVLVGGVDIPSQLIELGLVDEFRFAVWPVIVGEGRRLLKGINLPEKLQLKLVDSKTFKSGCVALRYLKQ